MINTRVHDHGPDEGDGLGCIERRVEAGTESPHMTLVRGACLEDDGCALGAHADASPVKPQASCIVLPVVDVINARSRCSHVAFPDDHTPSCPDSTDDADGGRPHHCRTAKAIGHSIHLCTCRWAWPDPAEEILPVLESTPRRIALVGVLTDLMAVLDAELDDLAEVRRTDDRVIATDAEHATDKLNVVWAKLAEARTAVRSCDLGYLPLPEVG